MLYYPLHINKNEGNYEKNGRESGFNSVHFTKGGRSRYPPHRGVRVESSSLVHICEGGEPSPPSKRSSDFILAHLCGVENYALRGNGDSSTLDAFVGVVQPHKKLGGVVHHSYICSQTKKKKIVGRRVVKTSHDFNVRSLFFKLN
jgi:hypothetical protein